MTIYWDILDYSMVECPSGKWLCFENSSSSCFLQQQLSLFLSCLLVQVSAANHLLNVLFFYCTWLTGSSLLHVLDGVLEVHCHLQVFCCSSFYLYLWNIWHQFWIIYLSFFFWSISLRWCMQDCCHIFLKPLSMCHVHGRAFCSLIPAEQEPTLVLVLPHTLIL